MFADCREDCCRIAADDVGELTLGNGADVLSQTALSDSAIDEAVEDFKDFSRWCVGESTDEADVDHLIGEGTDILAGSSPAATGVDSQISSDDEVVRDVSPSVGVHVEGLDLAKSCRALSLSCAWLSSGGMNSDERSWSDRKD